MFYYVKTTSSLFYQNLREYFNTFLDPIILLTSFSSRAYTILATLISFVKMRVQLMSYVLKQFSKSVQYFLYLSITYEQNNKFILFIILITSNKLTIKATWQKSFLGFNEILLFIQVINITRNMAREADINNCF